VAGVLGGMEHLNRLGLEIERQAFHVFLATELWETELVLTVDGQEIVVPADGLRAIGMTWRWRCGSIRTGRPMTPGATRSARRVGWCASRRPAGRRS